MVKNIGTDRAKSIGYFINIISLIDKKLKLPGSSVRMRLIAKDLEKIEDFDDAYSMSKFGQEKIITGLLKKYYQLPERTIREFL